MLHFNATNPFNAFQRHQRPLNLLWRKEVLICWALVMTGLNSFSERNKVCVLTLPHVGWAGLSRAERRSQQAQMTTVLPFSWLFKKSCGVSGNDTSPSHKCHPARLFPRPTCSLEGSSVKYLKLKCFTGEKESDNTADPHFRSKMRTTGVRSQPVGTQWTLRL